MKILLILLMTTNVFALDLMGGKLVDKKTDEYIALHCMHQVLDECVEAHFVTGNHILNESLLLPMGDINEDRYERWGIFETITTIASTSRAPFPYPWYLANMRNVTRKLRKAFKIMMNENQKNEVVKLTHKNFLEVIKAIKEQ
jgi:hypothetical protein